MCSSRPDQDIQKTIDNLFSFDKRAIWKHLTYVIDKVYDAYDYNKISAPFHLLDYAKCWFFHSICLVVIQSQNRWIIIIIPFDWINSFTNTVILPILATCFTCLLLNSILYIDTILDSINYVHSFLFYIHLF
jgi:hypothetical protein